jgi:hypothetical protein
MMAVGHLGTMLCVNVKLSIVNEIYMLAQKKTRENRKKFYMGTLL